MCPRTPRYPFLNWYPHFLDQRYAPGQLSYPAVAAASMKINSTLPSSAAVERVFSVAAQVLTARHCHMSDTLEQVTSAHLPWVTLTVAESGDDDKGSTNADSLYLMYLLYCHIYFIMKIVQVVHTEERRRRRRKKNKQTNKQTNKPKTHTMCQ